MERIVTLTVNPAIDKSTAVAQVMADRKLRCEAPRWEPGGGGINVSRALARLGSESLAVYSAGGPAGELLERLLDEEGIEQSCLPIEGWTRENLVVHEHSSDQRFRFGMPGPELHREEWEGCLEELERLDPPPAFLVASGSLPSGVPDDFYARLLELAQAKKWRVVLDTSGEPLVQAARRGGAFLLKPNHRELGELFPDEDVDRMGIGSAAQRLVQEGAAELVVVSLGAAGAVLATRDTRLRLIAPTVPIVSKVGAGDSMVAGIVARLASGADITEAVTFGIAAGAAAVMTPGTELCRRADAERLVQLVEEA